MHGGLAQQHTTLQRQHALIESVVRKVWRTAGHPVSHPAPLTPETPVPPLQTRSQAPTAELSEQQGCSAGYNHPISADMRYTKLYDTQHDTQHAANSIKVTQDCLHENTLIFKIRKSI